MNLTDFQNFWIPNWSYVNKISFWDVLSMVQNLKFNIKWIGILKIKLDFRNIDWELKVKVLEDQNLSPYWYFGILIVNLEI